MPRGQKYNNAILFLTIGIDQLENSPVDRMTKRIETRENNNRSESDR